MQVNQPVQSFNQMQLQAFLSDSIGMHEKCEKLRVRVNRIARNLTESFRAMEGSGGLTDITGRKTWKHYSDEAVNIVDYIRMLPKAAKGFDDLFRTLKGNSRDRQIISSSVTILLSFEPRISFAFSRLQAISEVFNEHQTTISNSLDETEGDKHKRLILDRRRFMNRFHAAIKGLKTCTTQIASSANPLAVPLKGGATEGLKPGEAALLDLKLIKIENSNNSLLFTMVKINNSLAGAIKKITNSSSIVKGKHYNPLKLQKLQEVQNIYTNCLPLQAALEESQAITSIRMLSYAMMGTGSSEEGVSRIKDVIVSHVKLLFFSYQQYEVFLKDQVKDYFHALYKQDVNGDLPLDKQLRLVETLGTITTVFKRVHESCVELFSKPKEMSPVTRRAPTPCAGSSSQSTPAEKIPPSFPPPVTRRAPTPFAGSSSHGTPAEKTPPSSPFQKEKSPFLRPAPLVQVSSSHSSDDTYLPVTPLKGVNPFTDGGTSAFSQTTFAVTSAGKSPKPPVKKRLDRDWVFYC
ncbi:MAG: hypothetical protein S4CHLAM27_12340 [Chlamydiia bacterium]|nr:hypothetical protein [Chlamydiia bacterium]